MLTDTHCHLNDDRFAGRLPAVLARAEGAGVGQIIVPGWDRDSSRRAVALAAAYPGVRAAVGLHPWFLGDGDISWLPALLDDSGVVAVGEIGLDGAIEPEQPALQEAAFRAQLALAAARGLPVLVHACKRWDRLLPCLRDVLGMRAVIHAFSGSREILQALLDFGCYIGFGGGVTRPNAQRTRAAALVTPADRLLLETDAPYIGMDGILPEQVEPAHIPRVLQTLAELRGEDAQVLAERIAGNVRGLVGGD